MLRIDRVTGDVTTLIGPTPTIGMVQTLTTPGSLTSIQGVGFENASIEIAGLPAPILRRSANEILFQAPWETPMTADVVTIPEGGRPYFEDSAPLSITEFAPQAIVLGTQTAGFTPIAIHTDFRSLVTAESPAARGEAVHIYLTGGGPVSTPVATGVPGPLDPLSKITTPIRVVADDQPLDVTYIGLAPGLVGLWQMDVILPSVWSRPALTIQIEYDAPPPNSFRQSLSLPAIPMTTP
jgi:uncharacterized protein (TIGR03437 family)